MYNIGDKILVTVVNTGCGNDNSIILSDGQVLSEAHVKALERQGSIQNYQDFTQISEHEKRVETEKYFRVTWEDGKTICVTSFLGHKPTMQDFNMYGGLDCLNYGHDSIKNVVEVDYEKLSDFEKGQVKRCYF